MLASAAITSRTNARVKALRAAFSGRATSPGELIGIEGEHLLAEALRSGLQIESVFVRQGSEATLERPQLAGLRVSEVYVCSPEVFASAVETGSPQGIAAMVRIPRLELPESPDVTLLLEDLQDPGNFGTLLRSAEAFGCEQVLMTPGTANPWSPKVVRASAGSVFRVPVRRAPLQELAAMVRPSTIYAAVAQEHGASSVAETVLRMPCTLMIGNEGAGLSQSGLALAKYRVRIPCAVESLNAAVAGSLLLYEAMRQRGAGELQEVRRA